MTSTQLLPVPVRAPQQSSGPGISADRLLASTRHTAGSRLAQTKGAAFAAHPAARQGGLAVPITKNPVSILNVVRISIILAAATWLFLDIGGPFIVRL